MSDFSRMLMDFNIFCCKLFQEHQVFIHADQAVDHVLQKSLMMWRL